MTLRSLLRPAVFTLAALSAQACTEVHVHHGEAPPAGESSGSSGFDPGEGGAPGDGGYGYGASYGSSSSGEGAMEPMGPPMCDDALKRCPQEFTYADAGHSTVELRGNFAPDGWDVGAPMQLSGGVWSATVDVPWDAPVEYKLVVDGEWILDPANPDKVDDGFGGENSVVDGTTCTEWTCAPPQLGDFDWRDAVLYFVFVDRFVDGDPSNNASVDGVKSAANYQGGDWAGLQSKVEDGYFEELGVNTLWLSVPMDNTDASGWGTDGELYSSYHGYWPRDLDAVNPRFGTMQELLDVIDAAHARDMKVIVDYAMNHVHTSSPVYTQHPEWFWPLNDGGKYCVCGADCSWDGADGRRCWFTDYLPDFNFTNPDARAYSVNNAIQWIQDTGIDGFRLDAVKHIEDQWLLDLRARVKTEIEPVSGQHFYMVGETFTGDKDTINYYVDPFSMLDGQFDFPMRNAIVNTLLIRGGSMHDLDGFLNANDGFYGAGIMSTFVGNHDVPRSIHFAQDTPLWGDAWAGGKEIAWNNTPGLPGEQSAFERMANAFAVIFTLPGVPLIYYGDEIGLPGAGDPDNRRFMQWSGVESRQLLLKERVSKLAHIRSEHPALRRGTRSTLHVGHDTLVYRMITSGDDVVVAINRGDGDATVDNIPAGSWTDAMDQSSHGGGSMSVPARSTRILVQ